MAGIEAMLIDRQVAALKTACQTNIDEDDKSRATVVMVGEYTGDITRDRVVIQCLDAHPIKESEWANSMQGLKEDMGFSLPDDARRFIGGTRLDTLRGTVKIQCHVDENGSDAMGIRHRVLSRVEQTLESARLAGFKDEFNSIAQLFHIVRVLKYQKVEDNMVAYIDWAAVVTKRPQ